MLMPGKQVAINFNQLYPKFHAQLPNKMVDTSIWKRKACNNPKNTRNNNKRPGDDPVVPIGELRIIVVNSFIKRRPKEWKSSKTHTERIAIKKRDTVAIPGLC